MDNAFKKYSIDTTDYQVGQDNVQKWGFDIHNPVFGISAGLVVFCLISLLLVEPTTARDVLNGLKNGIIEQFDAFFMWSTNFFLLFAVALLFSPLGKIRLGGKEATPDHSTVSWLSMLFAAGMGIGLVFFGVSEPMSHFSSAIGGVNVENGVRTDWAPLGGAEGDASAASALGMAATIYHWALHPWSIYALLALGLAIFSFNKGLPLTMRSIFYPLFGERVWGWTGHIIDILAVVATVFGLATSLGYGASQAATGLNFLFDVPMTNTTQVLLIIGITALALISVVAGLDKGVKILSEINMGLAALLLLFVIVVGPTIAILTGFFENIVSYVANIPALSMPFGREDVNYSQGWTAFYWAWWISWSPFVGMFIARVSKGRTVREFITAVLIVPTLVTLVWMSVFGGMAIEQVVDKVGQLGSEGLTDVSLAMFEMFDVLPMGKVLSTIAVVLVLVFFITSSDSGSLVIDSITAGGKVDAPVLQRIFWAVMEGAVAAVLLWIGGTEAIQALQAGAISTALPFTIVLLLMCVSLVMGMRTERQQ